ncbi:MAG: iron-containing alcohol dehydrogenase [Bacteroidetes bacterium]|nr:iron-containing alcohol dehydrogenase [Bacteroidota bacterium]
MACFTLYNPVKLHFGKGALDKLGKEAGEYGKKALLILGKGSVKANGSYHEAVSKLKEGSVEVFEYSGIKSNPIIEDIEKAAELGRKKKVNMVIGLGGGSVIDSAKIIALAISNPESPWDIVTGKVRPKSALPVICILTLAATGTEMNPYAVVQNTKLKKKVGYGHKLMYPKISFLDPTFTLSVPKNYTAYGIVDLIAHSLEAYFGKGEASLSDRFTLAIIKEAIKNGPELLENLNNYELREKIMYAATCALNGITFVGKESPDWGVHDIGHTLSVLYDIPHGASLSIAYPAWLKLQSQRIPEKIIELGYNVFATSKVDDTIYKLEYFFKMLGSPIKLSQAGINLDEKAKEQLFKTMAKNKVSGVAHTLSEEDYRFLIEEML